MRSDEQQAAVYLLQWSGMVDFAGMGVLPLLLAGIGLIALVWTALRAGPPPNPPPDPPSD